MAESKAWTTLEIKELLDRSDLAVQKAVVAIYRFQTPDEQDCETTRYQNGMGYNAFDAEIMSSFAKWILSGKNLTVKQMAIARKKIKKYVRQLTSVANEGCREAIAG